MSFSVLICLLRFFVTDGIPLLRRPCLPPRVPYFTGRQKECDEIIGHLFSESTRIVSIWGSPGFGKTSVAIAVGHEIQSRGLPVFWLSLRGLRSKADLTSKLLSFFRQPSKNTFAAQHLSRDDELCQLFNEISDDLVFILDNADDLLESGLPKVNREEVIEFLEEILRRNQNVKFAITTRESFGFLDLHLEFHQSAVRIRPLEEASSRSLVHELLPDASTSDCKRITQICGHVPLAIKLLCSSISEDSAQPSQFLNELLVSSTESIVEMLDSSGYPTNHRLRFLFNSSFERLCEQEKEALVSFSVLPENFDAEVAASVLGKTLRLTKNILQSLERKSLLDSSLERRSFKMHKLLQLFARERGNNEMKEIFYDSKTRFHAYYLSLFKKLNEQFLTGRSMSAFIAFYEDKQNIVQSLVDGCSYPETANHVFDVLDNAEIFLDSIFWTHAGATCPFDLIYDSALKAASRYGNTVYYRRLLVSKSFGQLMWGAQGGSVKLLREVDEIRQAATPCTSDEKAKYLCYFGMYQLVTGETESGVKYLQKALPLMRNSPEHRILRLVIFQIFSLYWQGAKNPSHSRQFYGKALFESMAIGDIQLLVIPSSEMETANETKGRKIPNRCADALCNKPMEVQIIYHVLQASQHLPVIGTNKSLQDIVLKIRDDVEAALPCGETGLFSFHRVVVAALLNVCSKCKEKENLAHSQTSREQKPQEKSGNSKHKTEEEYCSASSNKNCKDPDNVKNKQCILVSSGALQSRQRATDIAIERFGAEHPNTADSYHTLGITQHLLGDFSSALRSLQKALNIRQMVLGDDHLGTADIYRSLGATYYQLGDFSAALQCRQQALDIRRKVLGEEHPSLVECYGELSCTQFALGDFSLVVESDQRALEVCMKMFGEEDPRTPCILLSLANTQRLLGDLTTALEYAECALCITVRLFGTENVITARGYCSLGDIHLSLENHAVARYYYQMAHNIDARLFGNEHVNTLRYTYLQWVQFLQLASIHYHKLNAINFILVSDLNAALQDALCALSMDVNLYGEEHVNTADSFYILGSIQFELFDYNSSLSYHERALDIKLKVLGEEHSGTVFSFMFLALVHFALGNFTTAKEYAECVLSIRPSLSEEDIIANFFKCGPLILAIQHLLADKDIFASLKNSFHRDSDGGV